MTQEEALDILKLGHSVFLSGAAGSGKTHVLNRYIDYLRDHEMSVAVTASTGIAAVHIGGQTIHSWSGIGIKDHFTPYDLEMLEQQKSLYDRWNRTSVLVIDEISMLGGNQLDMVDAIARRLRRDDRPFGGMQVVFVGDFFQLPPVSRGAQAVYAFESNVWQEAPPVVCYLETQYRHSDPALSTLLNDIRARQVTEATRRALESRCDLLLDDGFEGSDVTRLFTHNVDVDGMNAQEIGKIHGDTATYTMSSSGRKEYVETLKKGCLAPESLTLKVGAKVMFVKNDPLGRFVNGTQGRVVELGEIAPTVEIISGSEREEVAADPVEWGYDVDGTRKAQITQVPLRLAWAITVHKSQGMTLTSAYVDLTKTFVPGQGYVALSRVGALDDLYLAGFNERALEVDPRVSRLDAELRSRSQRAATRLAAMTREEITEAQQSFITANGGTLDPKKGKSKDKRKIQKQYRGATLDATKSFLEEKMPLADIARARNLKVRTIVGHIEDLIARGDAVDIEYLRPATPHLQSMFQALELEQAREGEARLKNVKEALEQENIAVTYEELSLARLFLKQE